MRTRECLNALTGKAFFRLRAMALQKASNEQRLTGLRVELEKIVPDITDQYSMFKVDNDYLRVKVRNLHAFQISLFNRVIGDFQKVVIVDIGDSAGTHLQYINSLYSSQKKIKCLGVNLDPRAVERIKGKGLEAVKAGAEELDKYNIHPDIFLCFEILEHLTDPIGFLHELSSKTNARFLIATVPYLRKSRVALHHIRGSRQERVCAENTHIFELSPRDWTLLMLHAGWKVVYNKIYYQYPKKWPVVSPLLASHWREADYEGFWGAILEKDTTISDRYQDWDD